MASDSHTGIHYLLSNLGVIKLQMSGEERNMWRIFLNHRKFKAAKEACLSSAQRNKVRVSEVECL